MILDNRATIKNCELFVEYTIPANDIAYISITFNPHKNLEVEKVVLGDNAVTSISSDYETLTYINSMTDGEHFTLDKKKYASTFNFAFDLRYWPSF